MKTNWFKRSFIVLLIFVLFIQIACVFAAVQLTYFKDEAEDSSFFNKIAFSSRNISPLNPDKNTLSVLINSNGENIEIWETTIDSSKGVVILFHGYLGQKSSLIDNAFLFNKMGYNTILVDFRASGNSDGNFTTIGYLEAENVKSVYEYAKEKYSNITLYGISMGAASIMRAISIYNLESQKVILECPFSTMKQTIRNRFERFHVPTFILVDLLTFWGGKIHGFDAFSHNPVDYSKDIHVKTLLMSGDEDPNVQNFETDKIFKNIGTSDKSIYIFKGAGHENYIYNYTDEWYATVDKFLNSI